MAAFVASPTNPAAGYVNQVVAPAPLIWTLFGGELLCVAAAVGWWRTRRERRRRQGLAGHRQWARYLGKRVARRSAAQTRPNLARRRAPLEELAIPLAKAAGEGHRLYLRHEDSIAVMAPPRAFKTAAVLAGLVRSAPGPVVAGSTKGDLLSITYLARSAKGTVHVLDPGNVVGWPNPLRWSPVAGCDQPQVAISTAEAFAAASPDDAHTSNAKFFRKQARDVLRCLLHAAALDGRDMGSVVQWALRMDSPTLPAREILRSHPRAAPSWATALEEATSGDRGTGPLDSTKKTLADMLTMFADPTVLDSCCPPAGEAFDISRLLTSTDTVYVISGDHDTVAPLITAFVNEVLRQARAAAERRWPARLDPPLRCVIDEVGNVAPVPRLGSLMSRLGGQGITLAIGGQGLGQARDRWGEAGAAEVFGSATAKIVMGGTSEPELLSMMSALAGVVEVPATSTTVAHGQVVSATASDRERPILHPHQIRELPPSHGLLIYRQAPPVVAEFEPYWDSPWADEAQRSAETVARLTGRLE
ncbi:type IV secretory system conjugative DNA transfer family protein [Micromonospora sp. NPDC048063]|uniref:type IV secretory system conjugative DNA transfer family protein n=1 Tax=Micromonospora sp. NPDC048063 TaxID=3364256 RepID=UPI00371CEBAB